jgi:peptidoglycan/xylan/chitin deacetylase (PgdA/CDA1 family)
MAITFDDGYACIKEIAAPLLQQFGLRATVFLPVDLIERRRPFWWDELEDIVLGHDDLNLCVDGEHVSLGPPTAADRFWTPRSEATTARQSAFEEILARITRKRPADRDRIMDELRHQQAPPSRSPHDGPQSKRPMSPEEIRMIAGSIVDIGSHTRTHPWLTGLASEEQREEICGSVDRVEALTGYSPTSFAYPYGHSDELSQRLVADAKFAVGCRTGDRGVSRRSRSVALPRVRIGDWSATELERVLANVRPA